MKKDILYFPKLINCGGRLLDISSPVIMGIINITPDSFYSGSRVKTGKEIINKVSQMLGNGAAIIDLGAYSSRPGAAHIDSKEEISRLLPVLEILKKEFPDIFLSIDTFRSEIVKSVYDKFGAFIVNDISAGELDKEMINTVAELKLPYIAMHMKGTPETMQNNPQYNNIIKEIIDYFVKIIYTTRQAGIKDLIIDPGFGFGKTIEQNYEILKRLDEFKVLEQAILVGLSRKSMFHKVMQKTPEEVLPATIAAETIALQKGANILRVHDVQEAQQAIMVYSLSK